MPQLTPADVHNVAFSKPPIGKRGYNEDEVDAFLDLVEQALSQLIEENADLRQRVGELDQELAAAKKSPAPAQQAAPVAAQPKPEPARVVEPPKPASVEMKIIESGQRKYSIAEIINNLDIGYMRAFTRSNNKF